MVALGRDPLTPVRRFHYDTPMQAIQKFLAASVLVCLGVCLGCSAPPEPYKPIAGVKLLMVSVVDPAADVVWDSVGTIVTLEETQEIRPQSDEEWAAVRNSAVVLAESGNLLMMERRAMDTGDWRRWSLALVDAGEAALKAAEAKDAEAVFAVGEQVYMACLGCHEKYWPEVPASP